MTRRCQHCSHNMAETTVPAPLCKRCAIEFYTGLLNLATIRRVVGIQPTLLAFEQAMVREREITSLAAFVNAARPKRPHVTYAPYRVNFLPPVTVRRKPKVHGRRRFVLPWRKVS